MHSLAWNTTFGPFCSHHDSSGGGGWTDFPPQRDHAGSFSGRDSEHSDREGGGGGGSALAEALALRERERKRTLEERAAHERSEKQRMEVSAVYENPNL